MKCNETTKWNAEVVEFIDKMEMFNGSYIETKGLMQQYSFEFL